jgi:hypothetical protein
MANVWASMKKMELPNPINWIKIHPNLSISVGQIVKSFQLWRVPHLEASLAWPANVSGSFDGRPPWHRVGRHNTCTNV